MKKDNKREQSIYCKIRNKLKGRWFKEQKNVNLERLTRTKGPKEVGHNVYWRLISLMKYYHVGRREKMSRFGRYIRIRKLNNKVKENGK